jgi:hypothetical protein
MPGIDYSKLTREERLKLYVAIALPIARRIAEERIGRGEPVVPGAAQARAGSQTRLEPSRLA